MALSTLPVIGALAAASPDAAAASKAELNKPTIVLVHGAFADSSSWDGVITPLLTDGYPVVAASIPMRGLKSDAEYVAALLKGIDGPIVLVGHSYGGAVITNAVGTNGNIKSLVYVAGFAPDAGETGVQLTGRFPGSTLGPTLAPPVALPGGGKDLYILQRDYHKQFAADLPSAQAQRMAVTQRPINEAALNEPAESAAWKSLPSWFIFGSLDLNIPAAAHAFMAERAGAKGTVRVEGASHVVMISHPDAVVKIIRQAAGSGDASGVPARGAFAPKTFLPAPVVPLMSEPPARLIVDAPLPEQLAKGYVVVRYRAENARILPVYGTAALGIAPRIGHLHVTLDDQPWHWLDSSGEPLSINGLPPGAHKLLIELQDTSHRGLDSTTVTFEIPQPAQTSR
jgi:pimeloyl-ACP methyl ester carboxylesterase